MRDAAADGSGNPFENALPVGIHTLASDEDSLVGLCPNGQNITGRAGRWDTTPYPSSFPAIGSWGRMAA